MDSKVYAEYQRPTNYIVLGAAKLKNILTESVSDNQFLQKSFQDQTLNGCSFNEGLDNPSIFLNGKHYRKQLISGISK